MHTPTLIVMLFEDLASRQVHLGGRARPEDPNPIFMGYSVGKWAGTPWWWRPSASTEKRGSITAVILMASG